MANVSMKSKKADWKTMIKRWLMAMLWTMGAAALTALGVDRGWIQLKGIGYAAMVILIMAGVLCGGGGKERAALLPGLLTAAGYIVVLAVWNLLLFGGEFDSAPLSAVLVCLGVLLRTGSTRWMTEGKRRGGYKIPKR
jgi:hypothetical protein